MEEGKKIDASPAFEGEGHKRKGWALMLFNTELELGISNKPNKWVNTGIRYYNNGINALEAYANTPNPASQLVEGTTPEELKNEIEKMLVNYSDEKWLEENLYPFL
jgi:hypothetical protein